MSSQPLQPNAIGSVVPLFAGGGGGGGGATTLQQAYVNGNTIAVTAGNGTVDISNGADATDLLTLSRTFAGGGAAMTVSMGATTTGNALDVAMAAGATGRAISITDAGDGTGLFINKTGAAGVALRVQDGGSSVFVISNTGSIASTPTDGTNFTVDTTGAGNISLDSVASSNFTVSGAANDLTLGARGATITLNEAGEETLDAGFVATSVVGALNELLATATATTLQQAYANGNAISVTAGNGSVALSNATDATDVLTVDRTFAGGGDGISVTMGAATTAAGLRVVSSGVAATSYAAAFQSAATGAGAFAVGVVGTGLTADGLAVIRSPGAAATGGHVLSVTGNTNQESSPSGKFLFIGNSSGTGEQMDLDYRGSEIQRATSAATFAVTCTTTALPANATGTGYSITAGDGLGTGNGGDVTIDAGSAPGAGTDGVINIGTTTASQINAGAVILGVDGALGAPTYSFASSTNTGMFWDGSFLRFGTSGVERLRLSGGGGAFSGGVTITGNLDHNGTGVGFYGTAPVAQSAAYTVSNLTTDRSYDADSTSLDEIADVLGTLIGDLQATGLIG